MKEALQIIEGVQNPSLKIKELKAQILYRLEQYEDCFTVYRDIIKNCSDDYEDEREANLAAVSINLAIQKNVNNFVIQMKNFIYSQHYTFSM